MATDKFASELQHLQAAWRHFNAEFFDGKMKEPKFQVVGHKKFAGEWIAHKRRAAAFMPPFHDGTGTLKIASYLFRDEEKLKTALLHEMCHQAVSSFHHRDEIDKDGFHFPHGPIWREWAKKCGVEESLCDTDNEAVRETRRSPVVPKTGDFVFTQFFMAEKGKASIDVIQSTCYVAGRQDGNTYVLFVEPKNNHLCLSAVAPDASFLSPEKSEIPYLEQRVNHFLEDEKHRKLVAGAIKKSNSGQENLRPLFFFDLETRSYCGFEIQTRVSSPKMS